MKGKERIINFVVVAALIGYAVCSILIFKEAFGKEQNNALMHITSALTGLVGGIVAAAFGVEKPTLPSPDGPAVASTLGSMTQLKFQRMGSFASSIKEPKSKEKIGNLYAWAYMLVGITSLIIWAFLNDGATQTITNTGMTFIGMIVAIVGAYFKD